MRYQGVVLGDDPGFLRYMSTNIADVPIAFLENGCYIENKIWASIRWTYDYWGIEKQTTVFDFLKEGDYGYYALAWEEGMWHTYTTHSFKEGMIRRDNGYHEVKIWMPYSYIEKPGPEKIRREILRARNDPKRSNQVWIVNFHS